MDRFDDIWKNRFNETEVPEKEWSDPSDAVWASISEQIPVKRKSKKRFLIWFIFGIGLVTLGYFIAIFNSNDNSNNIKQPAISKQQKSKATSLNINQNKDLNRPNATKAKTITTATKNDAETNNLTSTTSKPANFESTSNIFDDENKLNSSKKVSNSERSISDPQSTDPIQFQQRDVNLFPVQNSFNVERPTTEKAAESEVEEELTPIDLSQIYEIKNKPFDLLAIDAPTQKTLDTVPVKATISKWQFAIDQGIVFWTHQLNNSFSTALEPFDFKYTNNIGYNAALSIKFKLFKNFYAVAGVGYEQVQVQSGHNGALVYNQNQEQNQENNNNYTLPLATPYGFMPSDFALFRTTAISEESVDLNVDFTSTHQIRNISIPIGFSWLPIGTQHRIKPVVGMALGTNYLFDLDNSLSKIDTHHDALNYQTNTAAVSKQTINNLHFDARLNTGIQYFINRNLDLKLDYNFIKGISPLFEADNFNTQINRHLLTIGLSRKF